MKGLRVETARGSVPVGGDERLAERLVANLVDNALRHNVAGGWIWVVTGVRGGQ